MSRLQRFARPVKSSADRPQLLIHRDFWMTVAGGVAAPITSQPWTWQRAKRMLTNGRYSDAKNGSWFACVRLIADTNRLRTENVQSVSMLVLDFDAGDRKSDLSTAFSPFEHIGYATFSHTREAPRYRVVLPLAVDHDPALLEAIYAWVERKGLHPDRQSYGPSHKFFAQTRPHGTDFDCWHNEGELLDLRHVGRRPRIAKRATSKPLSPAVGFKIERLLRRPTNVDPFRDPAWERRILDHLAHIAGREPGSIQVGKPFRSLTHEERRPSWCVFRGRDGDLLCKVFHSRDVTVVASEDEHEHSTTGGPSVFTMSEMLCSVLNGRLVKFEKGRQSMHGIWRRRFETEIGYIEPHRIPRVKSLSINWDDDRLREWSTEKRELLKKHLDGFEHLLRVRNVGEIEIQPAPFSHRFAASWVGACKRTLTGECVAMLFALGLIVTVDAFKPSKRKLLGLVLTRPEAEEYRRMKNTKYESIKRSR